MSSMKDIVGKRFGSLTVLELHHRGAGGKLYWLCECDCGNRSVVCGSNLTTGHTTEYAGEEHPIAEWARILGVTYNALYFRIKRGDLRDFEDYFDKL